MLEETNPAATSSIEDLDDAQLLHRLELETAAAMGRVYQVDDETPLDELLEEADAKADEGAEDKSWADAHKDYMDTQVERASMWVDSFFVDSEYEAEDAYSQIRLRPEFYYRKEQGAKGKFRFRVHMEAKAALKFKIKIAKTSGVSIDQLRWQLQALPHQESSRLKHQHSLQPLCKHNSN